MKILSLEIKNIRGIRDLTLTPDGKNLAIWGLNGSGKSAVVDALDFLLTEKMTRLTGSGTGGITLKTHGPHIDCDDPTEAIVSAKIQLPNNDTCEITRCLAEPGNLVCNVNPIPDLLENALSLARRSQHVLTRREILKFVTAEGKARSEQIQLLLNINEVEIVRQALVKVANNFKRQLKTEKGKFDLAKHDVKNTTLVEKLTEAAILDFINVNREKLGAVALKDLEFPNLKNGISSTALANKANVINETIARQDIANLVATVQRATEHGTESLGHSAEQLLKEINDDPSIRAALKHKQLIDLGAKLIEDDGNCPLCDAEWPQGELQTYLAKKGEKIKLAETITKQIDQSIQQIVKINGEISAALNQVIDISNRLSLNAETISLGQCLSKIEELTKKVSLITNDYEWNDSQSISISKHLSIEKLDKVVKRLEEELTHNVPKATPEQTAWELLTRLEENLRVYYREKRSYQKVLARKETADALLKHFEASRDNVLSGLYEEIRTKFTSLYKQLHGEDEKGFVASLEPDGPALKFEVDFYGRGRHPPHALHSEGHQDSMGVCLYLALADQLSKDILDLVILDDVVMSVDIEHRKQLCKVLKDNFSHRQFIITTHDQTWAEMLKKHKVVNSKGLKEFFNWTVEAGPNVNDHEQLWSKIEHDLANNDISAAAAKLRKGAEHRFFEICDELKVQIRFKPGGQWDFGDLSQAAIAGMKKLLKEAKASANSWSDVSRMAEITSFEADVLEAISEFEAEKWSVNPLVHYNDWMKLSPKEFRSVVAAYRYLFEVLACRLNQNCESLFYVTMAVMQPDAFRCKCGAINWTLNRK